MDQPSYTIRPERPADHPAIRRLVAAAFDPEPVADLVDAIRASEHYLPAMAFVAEIAGTVVGHTMISGATLRAADNEWPIVMLSPLAVAKTHRRQGIGGVLVRAVCAIVDQRGEPLVVIEGDPAYYGRFGFEHSLLYGIEIELPEWAPPEAAQVMRLASYDPALRGKVEYPPAFTALSQ